MIMKRYFIDCRKHPSDVKCTVALSADTKEELLEAVVQHGTKVHGYEDTPEKDSALARDMESAAQQSHQL